MRSWKRHLTGCTEVAQHAHQIHISSSRNLQRVLIASQVSSTRTCVSVLFFSEAITTVLRSPTPFMVLLWTSHSKRDITTPTNNPRFRSTAPSPKSRSDARVKQLLVRHRHENPNPMLIRTLLTCRTRVIISFRGLLKAFYLAACSVIGGTSTVVMHEQAIKCVNDPLPSYTLHVGRSHTCIIILLACWTCRRGAPLC